MKELPYYNTFFMTTHVPAIALAQEVAKLAPADMNQIFFASSGSEANDTNIRLVRTYWAQRDSRKNPISSAARMPITDRLSAQAASAA